MFLEKLSFGTIQQIDPQIVEVIIDRGQEMKKNKVQRVGTILNKELGSPYGVLVNRKETYSHDHGSMVAVSELQNCAGIAILVYSPHSYTVAQIHKAYSSNVEVFWERGLALIWLKEQLKNRTSWSTITSRANASAYF